MTKREFYTSISTNTTLSADLREMADKLLTQLDTTNERRKTSPAAQKATAERDAFRAQVAAILDEAPLSAAEIATIIGATTAKASAALRVLCENGIAGSVEFKPEGAKRKTRGYYRMAGE